MTNRACPSCRQHGRDRKGDNLVVYPDGGTHCFACGHHTNGSDKTERRAPIRLGQLEYRELPHRRLTEATCKKFGYQVDEDGHHEVARYWVGKQNVANHVRIVKPEKDFSWSPHSKDLPLWGQHLCPSEGRRIYVTEGEIDCMSVWQVLGGRDHVVSIPNGASSAVNDIRTNLDFLEGYDEVVLVFDADTAGREAAEKCAPLIRPGKCRVATLRYKDPNAYLQANEGRALVEDLHNAQTYRPKDLIHARDMVGRARPETTVYPYVWDCLDIKCIGREAGELIGIVSGTGMGKSTAVRTQIRADLDAGYHTGVLMLEETTQHTWDELIGLDIGKPVPQILRARKLKKIKPHLNLGVVDNLTDEEYREAEERLSKLPLILYDANELDPESILARMNYMVVGLGVTHLYLDHLTIATAGGENERKDIDNLMRDLRELAVRTGAVIHVVSQLTAKEGKSYEEGAQISLNKMRGSRFIEQTMNTVWALERNQQDDDEDARNTSTIRVLKARGSGTTGVAGHLYYDHATGRLRDTKASPLLAAQETTLDV